MPRKPEKKKSLLKREKVQGRDASVMYLDADGNPCEPDKAHAARILFDDGESLYGVFAD